MDEQPVIVGEVLFDRFGPDRRVLGGAPFNVAWHLQGFRQPSLLISRVGDDAPGADVKRAMHDWGMATGGVQTDATRPTGMVDVHMHGAGHSFDILPDQAYDFIQVEPALAALARIEPALIYHGTLVLRSQDGRRALQALLDASSAPVFLDVNLREPWWHPDDLPRLMQRARWMKVNDEELTTLCHLLHGESGPLHVLAERLRAAHELDLLIVTRGAAGAVAFDASGISARVEPQGDLEVIDTVGAGDAFTAVVIFGLMRHWPLGGILQRAQGFASRICTQSGAISRDPGLYRSLLDGWD